MVKKLQFSTIFTLCFKIHKINRELNNFNAVYYWEFESHQLTAYALFCVYNVNCCVYNIIGYHLHFYIKVYIYLWPFRSPRKIIGLLCNDAVNLFWNYDQPFSALTNSLRIAYLFALWGKQIRHAMSYPEVIYVKQ